MDCLRRDVSDAVPENGLLPASFLPGDSLLLLAGAMIAKGVMDFVPTMVILTTAASLGCWLSYLQGRWLGNTKIVKSWLMHLPAQYHQRAAPVQPPRPDGTAGWPLSGLCAYAAAHHGGHFGFAERAFSVLQLAERRAVGRDCGGDGLWHQPVPFIKRHEDQVMAILMVLPIVLFLGLGGSIVVIWKKRRQKA